MSAQSIGFRDFDWVQARSECSMMEVFQSLQLGAVEDIEKRNKQLGASRFKTTARGRVFKVFLDDVDEGVSITFVADRGEISAKGEGVTPFVDLHASLTLNDEGECRLLLDGKELEFWQFRRKSLEGLLFSRLT